MKYPTRGDCEVCDTPYRECAQFAMIGCKCCASCDHNADLRPDPNEHGPGPFKPAGKGPVIGHGCDVA